MNSNSTRDYLSVASSTSMRPPDQAGSCTSETDYWRVFVKSCDLSRDDIKVLHGMEYNSMTRLSMLGLTRNTQPLIDAGVSQAKATMILFFATYVVHCKYHQIGISKDLTFDQVLEFNFLMSNPNELRCNTNQSMLPSMAAPAYTVPPSLGAGIPTIPGPATRGTAPAVVNSAAYQAAPLTPPSSSMTAQEPLDSMSVSNHSMGSAASSKGSSSKGSSSKGSSSKGSSKSSSSKGRSSRHHHRRKKRLSDPESYAQGGPDSLNNNSINSSSKTSNNPTPPPATTATAPNYDSESSMTSKSSMRSARSSGSYSKKNVSWKPQIAKFSSIPPSIQEESYDPPTTPRGSSHKVVALTKSNSDRWGATTTATPRVSSSSDANENPASGGGGGWSSSDDEQKYSVASCPVKLNNNRGQQQRLSIISHDTNSTATTSSTTSSMGNRWSSTSNLMETSARSAPESSGLGEKIKPSRSADNLMSCPHRRASVDAATKLLEAKLGAVFEQKRRGGRRRLKQQQPAAAGEEISPNSGRSRPPPPSRGTALTNIPLMLSFLESKKAAAPPPRCAAARSSMRWAQALDVDDEELTDDEDWDLDDDSSDDSGSDSESDSDDSDSDSDDEDSDSSEDEDDSEDEDNDKPMPANRTKGTAASSASSTSDTVTWKTHNVTIEEWTMPMNQVLPVNLQDLFRQAAMNPEMDVQKHIHEALSKTMAPPPAPATTSSSRQQRNSGSNRKAGRSPTRQGSGGSRSVASNGSRSLVSRSPTRQRNGLIATTRAA